MEEMADKLGIGLQSYGQRDPLVEYMIQQPYRILLNARRHLVEHIKTRCV